MYVLLIQWKRGLPKDGFKLKYNAIFCFVGIPKKKVIKITDVFVFIFQM